MKVGKYISSHLTAQDLPQPVAITIERVVEEAFEFEGKTSEKLVLYARGGTRGIVLNRSSITQLVSITGSDETANWIGKRVEVFNDRSVMFGGRATGGIRFRAVTGAPAAAAPAAPAPPQPQPVEQPAAAYGDGEFPPSNEEIPF